MVKILLKAAVLLFIVFSIYFIVNPAACSNMLAGRERVAPADGTEERWRSPMAEEEQTLSPAASGSEDAAAPQDEMYPYDGQGVFDTNTMKEEAPAPVYSQADIDYAVASRYVELEREYALNHPVGKDTSREIAFIVMDDFEMSPAEWESFLSRATAANLFDRVRHEQAAASLED